MARDRSERDCSARLFRAERAFRIVANHHEIDPRFRRPDGEPRAVFHRGSEIRADCYWHQVSDAQWLDRPGCARKAGGLRAGADDCLTKPFAFSDLLAKEYTRSNDGLAAAKII